MTEAEYLWDRFKHEQNLFATRVNFFLVAEALLAAGMANDKLAVFFCYMGVGISIFWIMVVLVHTYRVGLPVLGRLLQIHMERVNAGDATTKDAATFYHSTFQRGWLQIWVIMGIVVPLSLALAWIIAAVFLLR